MPAPCQAIGRARAGDTIVIDARGNRSYRGDVCAWTTSRLTIAGVHGRAHIDAAGASSEGKAIWVIAGDHTSIENVELSGARVADDNGAGIRLEGAGLTVRHCVFDHNQEGILAGTTRSATSSSGPACFATTARVTATRTTSTSTRSSMTG